MNRDKIGTQTRYIHQCTKRYVDVHSMSVSQSCLCSFLCNPYIHFKFPKFFYLLVQLEIVSKFKYLGIIFSDNGTFNTAVSTLSGQAKKVHFTMRTQTAKLRYPPPILLTHIFNVLVVPILEYGCFAISLEIFLHFCIYS